tara:strand:- start:35 stop:1675 length:1641 start_codon:yes stop_codon:yes gene_type:complete
MTFTPGSDEGRTDTFEAQTAPPDRSIDKKVKEEFDDAQNILTQTGEALYGLGLAGIYAITKSPQAVQAVDALRKKLEGKPFTPPTPNPDNLGGLVTLEAPTPTVEGTEPKELIPPISQTNAITRFFKGISPAGIDYVKGLVMGTKDEEPLDVEAELKKYYEQQDLELKRDEPQDIVISGAKVRARRIMDRDVKDFLLRYPNIDPTRASRYVDLNARKVTDVARTIEFLNDLYADKSLNRDTATPEDVAAEFSVVFGVNAKPEDIQKIIEERGEITFTTARRKAEGQPPYIIKDLDDLMTVYFERLDVLKKANVFDEGHVFAVNSLLRDKNVSDLATYGSNIEPEIARSIEQLIDKQTLEELIAPGQGPAYLEKVVQGNRSRKDTVDPDKAVARVFGGAYGAEEDFLNFMFPERTVDAKVPPELKDTFVDLYNKELAALLQNFPKSKPGQGGLQIGSYTLERLKEQVQNLVAEEMNLARGLNDALNETEYARIKRENPEILLYLDERFGGKEQYVVPDKKARRIRRKGIDTRGLDEFRVGSSWDIGE